MPRLLLLIGLVLPIVSCAADRPSPRFPAGIDHGAFTELLARYVDERGLVDYDGWRASAADVAALDGYLAAYAPAPETPATGADRHAALLNLYNAITIRAVLRLDPEKSFWDHDPFTDAAWTVGGVRVSLDQVEHVAVRPEVGYRGHAALVCAAMSCPPLAREAFVAERLDAQLDERMAAWLAREDLNRFDPAAKTARVSKIFSWFAEDFREPGLQAILARHAPEAARALLAEGGFAVSYLDYDKSLNER